MSESPFPSTQCLTANRIRTTTPSAKLKTSWSKRSSRPLAAGAVLLRPRDLADRVADQVYGRTRPSGAARVHSQAKSDTIIGVLTLVDLALTGSLLIIVIFSGYENFVSKIDHTNHKDWPEWMGTIDFSALKLKMLSSIVAISAVQLLKQFMALKTVTPESEKILYWMVIIHVVFVVSSVLLALSDRIAGHGSSDTSKDGH